MEINKRYALIPTMIHKFIEESCSNKNMARTIQKNGGYFEVLATNTIGGEDFVTAVQFPKTGEIFNDMGSGDEYFEIYEDEFRFFTEYTEVEVPDGIRSMTLDVNKTNAAAMIQLIQNTFLAD